MRGKKDHGGAVAKQHQVKRSPHWGTVCKNHLEMQPACICGCTVELQVHHIIPFHLVILLGRPDLELDHRNLVTVCACPKHEHHLLFGHLDDYASYNKDVRDIIMRYCDKSPAEVKADEFYRTLHANRPKPWDKMSDHEKATLKKLTHHLHPIHAAPHAPVHREAPPAAPAAPAASPAPAVTAPQPAPPPPPGS